jgi:Yip1-like protein
MRRLRESGSGLGFAIGYHSAIVTFRQRLVGATMLDARVYEDLEANTSATWQAVLVVLLSSLAAGVSTGAAKLEAQAIIVGTLGGFVAWISWAALIYLVGTHLLPEPQTRANVGELLRTLAFAAAPGILRVVGAVPALAFPAFAVTSVWMLAAMVVAVRQALDYRSTSRAIAVCAVGWLLSLAIAAITGIFFPAIVS